MRSSARIWLSMVGLIFTMDLGWTSEQAITEPTPTIKPEKSDDTLYDISTDFSRFELRTRSYIDNIKRQFATLSDASQFITEADGYFLKVPMNKTKIVTTKTRDVCHCEGQLLSPCPVQCMYSCYLHYTSWQYVDDCRGIYWSYCYCLNPKEDVDKSYAKQCYNLIELEKNCVDETTEFLPHHSPCSIHIDKNHLLGTFEIEKKILTQPLDKYFQSYDFQLAKLKRASLHLMNLAEFVKGMDEISIEGSVDQLLSEVRTGYNQLKKKITLEVMKMRGRLEDVSQKVGELEEQTMTRINNALKKYGCCMKGLNSLDGGLDCSDDQVQPQPTSDAYDDDEYDDYD
ncbi:hypothetical protein GE061_004827 [Apolygus lucorum]|uniref:Uncharacterized protein n=1 Tax=Apolygus lucorum TaxID=248454 RepID=A0A8S9X237_APOLU|nr:hypothetical protein GE061_004827 [Apolygus lucorum]